MRVLVQARPSHPISQDLIGPLMDMFKHWRAQYRAQTEAFYFFTSGKGGFGIVNAPDEMALWRQLSTFPFAQFSDITVEPLIDGDEGLAAFADLMAQMMSGAGGGN